MNSTIKITKTNDSRLASVDFNNLTFGTTFSDHMFVVDYKDGAWHNPEIVPYGPFQIEPALMSLHYGQAIFEGMKASKHVNGSPLLMRPDLNAKRFNRSAERLCMPTVPEELFLEALHTLVDLDQAWIPPMKGSAMYVRPFMFATDSYIKVGESKTYRFMIITGPVGPYYPKPISLIAEEKYVRAVRGGTGEAKAAGNYAGSLLPAKIAREKGYDQVMWMDGHEFEYVEEVGTMNIFFVMYNKVYTPAASGSILKGTTRQSVITLLRDAGYEVFEKPISIHELLEAYDKGELQEVFGTGTAVVVAKVNKLAYQDRVLEFPLEDLKVGNWVKSQIDGLRAGTIEDTRGWIVPAKAGHLV